MLTAAENAAFEHEFNALSGGAGAGAAADPKQIFCQYWGYCKMALEAIGQLVKNIAVQLAIKTLIAAGDALQKTICK